MILPPWGDLPKSQVSNQLITEYITAIIDAHNADPDAHLGDGGSLASHRASEIIDALALSIVADKIQNGQLVLDHFSYSRLFIPLSPKDLELGGAGGSSFAYPVYAEIAVGGTTNTWYTAYTGGDEQYNKLGDSAFSPHFRFRVLPASDANMETYFGIGDFTGDGACGFKIVNATLKAVWWDDNPTEHLITLTGVDITIPHNYEVNALYNDRIDWLVDGVVAYSLPWQSDIVIEGGNIGLTFSVRKTTSTFKKLIIYQMVYEQDYF